MSDAAPDPASSGWRFQAEIYQHLDRKLRDSRFGGGASEAHGLLSALACRGVGGERLRAKAYLLQLTEPADLNLIEGLHEMIVRDLHADGFRFNLLLPGDPASPARKTAALADWCGGFLQGFLHDHDSEAPLADFPATVREAIDDITAISRADAPPPPGEALERQLFEIEEYLRVATQLIFEELNPAPPAANHTAANQ